MRLPVVIKMFWGVCLLAHLPLRLLAQSPPIIPPGVPEPGLVIWGSVVNVSNVNQSIQINSVAWSVTDGTNSAVYHGTSKPATQILSIDGQSYYVLEVAFDTRTFGSVSLANPSTVGIQSFELKPSPSPTYLLTPSINGLLANVRSVDGAPPSSATNVQVSGFNSTVRGRVIRVDLSINQEPYDAWAAGFFGSATNANAARNADPDQDGASNDSEFRAGTNPTDAASVLKILALSLNPAQTQVNISWQSVSNKAYVIESAASSTGAWSQVSAQLGTGTSTTQTNLVRGPTETNRFYRVRLAP